MSKKKKKNLLNSELCSKMSFLKQPWGSRAVTWQEPGSMCVERRVSFLNTLTEPQQHHHLLSATFAFAADRHRQKHLPLLFLTETSVTPPWWGEGRADGSILLPWAGPWANFSHLTWKTVLKVQNHQVCKGANTWPSAVFWILFFLNWILWSFAGRWSCVDWCEHCQLSGVVVMK